MLYLLLSESKLLIKCSISDTCYTDFAKMTGTIIKYLSGTVSVVECAFQCQINTSENYRDIFLSESNGNRSIVVKCRRKVNLVISQK